MFSDELSPSFNTLEVKTRESPQGGELIYKWNFTPSANLYGAPEGSRTDTRVVQVTGNYMNHQVVKLQIYLNY